MAKPKKSSKNVSAQVRLLKKSNRPKAKGKKSSGAKYTKAKLQEALAEAQQKLKDSGTIRYRELSRKYEIPRTTLKRHLDRPDMTFGSGRLQALPKESESTIAKFIVQCQLAGACTSKSF